MVEIGTRCGVFIELRHYIGSALNEWAAPFVQQQKQADTDKRAAFKACMSADPRTP